MTWDPADYPRSRGRVHLVQTGRLARMVLDNPAARNAMSIGMMADLLGAVAALVAEPPGVLILHGSDGFGFCSGGDLRDVRAHLMNPESAEGMPQAMGEAIAALASLPSVVIAAVEGHALGGGAELSQAADIVVMAEDACVGFVQARLGVSPGWGGAARVVHRVGRARALRVLATAERFYGPDAKSIGLADEVVDPGDAVGHAQELAQRMLQAPDAVLRGLVEIVRAPHPSRTESEVFARLWAGPDHRAALRAVEAGG